MNKNLLIAGLLILFSAGGFFGGMKYQQLSRLENQSLGQFGRNRGPLGIQGVQTRGGSGMVDGEIINKDAGSITVKLADESSKIILLSENTTINETTAGSVDDLETGKKVMVFGQQNSDGSISAVSIQLGEGFIRRGQLNQD